MPTRYADFCFKVRKDMPKAEELYLDVLQYHPLDA